MGPLFQLVVLVLFSDLASSYVIEGDEPGESLIWPTEYYLKAEMLDLKSGVVQPMDVWYSAELNKSRMDFYDGMVKRFYAWDPENDDEEMYMIHPITNDEVTNEILCHRADTEDATKDFLPKVEKFEYIGDQIYDGRTVQVWKSVRHDDEEINKIEQLLFVYRSDENVDIPVKFENKKFSIWNEALTKHTILNYYQFKTSVDPEDLDVTKREECSDVGKVGRNLRVDLEILHPHIPGDVDIAFHSYKKHYNKNIPKHEHEMRKAIFEDNWRRVVNHNRKNQGYKLAINKFADRSDEELSYLTATRSSGAHTTGSIPFPHSKDELKTMEENLPESYDMRIDGVISPVKNQGRCGSCWAFSTTAAVEGALARKNGGKDMDLSEQSLVDCAWADNLGCDGGLIDGAFKHIAKHGIPSQREYGPYLQQDGYCNLENITEVYTIESFAKVPSLSETAFKVTLFKYGPITVAVHAGKNMMLYSSGVFYDIECEKQMINHGVTIVGYGVRDGVNYWIIKNSWGEDWGQDGYILMSTVNDNCNVMSEGYFPIV